MKPQTSILKIVMVLAVLNSSAVSGVKFNLEVQLRKPQLFANDTVLRAGHFTDVAEKEKTEFKFQCKSGDCVSTWIAKIEVRADRTDPYFELSALLVAHLYEEITAGQQTDFVYQSRAYPILVKTTNTLFGGVFELPSKDLGLTLMIIPTKMLKK